MMLTPLLCSSLLLLFTCFLLLSSISAAKGIQYDQHCGSIVPASIPTVFFSDPSFSFWLSNGYFAGGGDLFSLGGDSSPPSRTFSFHTRDIHETGNSDALQLVGVMNIVLSEANKSRRQLTRRLEARLVLSGFWSKSKGKLCLVGNGEFYTHNRTSHSSSIDMRGAITAVVKLNLFPSSNISTSFITGTVESLDSEDDGRKMAFKTYRKTFEKISLLAYNDMSNYTSTMIDKVKESCSMLKTEEHSRNIDHNMTCSGLYNYLITGKYRLKRNETPALLGYSAQFMYLGNVLCSQDGNLRMLIGFSNSTESVYEKPMVPENSLVAEGFWDLEKKRLCLIACHILWENSTASVADCNIRLSLWLPASVSLKKRSLVNGHIWKEKGSDQTSSNTIVPFQRINKEYYDTNPDIKYNYTYLEAAKRSCEPNNVKKSSNKRYPDPRNINDMQFSMSLRDGKGKTYRGVASVFSLNDDYTYGNNYIHSIGNLTIPAVSTALAAEDNIRIWNISYKISYSVSNTLVSDSYSVSNTSVSDSYSVSNTLVSDSYSLSNTSVSDAFYFQNELSEEQEVVAEGTYNSNTGKLCMIGCRNLGSLSDKSEWKDEDFDNMDCEVLIDIQLSPLNSEFGEHHSGKFTSLRKEKDSLYFSPLEISSQVMYGYQAIMNIKRMDIEVAMLLISLTFSCVCIVMQIFHVRKHPDVLPSISIVMLVILTLSHMIPLLLNFEALLMKNTKNENLLLSTGGWLEGKEVIVRFMTMLALLLQFRLLHLSWSGRLKKGLWIAEKDTLLFCLLLYLAGALLNWYIKSSSDASQSQWQGLVLQHHSLWKDLMNYAGLVLDGFLLPQVIMNMLLESQDKALHPFFYAGTTIVRAFPHLYDVYRAHHYVNFTSSQIYAGPDEDYYSLTWDIITPCGGIVFAVLIFLQQRYGGACIIPTRFRKVAKYEAVPTVSG